MGNTSNVGEEKFLYQLMSILYEMQLPIVFKGAMVLKVIQYQYNDKQGLVRETHDVDGDWVGTVPSMQYLTNQLQIAVNRIDKNIRLSLLELTEIINRQDLTLLGLILNRL